MRNVYTLTAPSVGVYDKTNTFSVLYNAYIQELSADLASGTLNQTVISGGGLSLAPTGTGVTISEDFEDSTYNVTISGDWTRQAKAHGGSYGLASSNKGVPNSHSYAYVDFTVPTDATVSFWLYISSENGYDYCTILLDGVQKVKRSGSLGWVQESYSVTAGTHRLSFDYSKDGSSNVGDDLSAIDDLSIVVSSCVYLTGDRKSPGYPLRGIADVNSTLSWTTIIPSGCAIQVKTAVTTNSTPPADGDYTVATSGSLPPGISVSDDLTGKYLWIWELLSTSSDLATPTLLTVESGLQQVVASPVYPALVFDRVNLPDFPTPFKFTTDPSAGIYSGETEDWEISLDHGFWTCFAEYNGVRSVPVTIQIHEVESRWLYLVENIAKYLPKPTHGLYLFENIAKYMLWTKKRALYQYENITLDPPFPTLYSLSQTRATRGSLITLTGTGFGYKFDSDIANQDRFLRGYGGLVYIGDVICNIVSWSWTQIVFQIPNEAVTGAVKVELTVPTLRESNVIGLEVIGIEPTDVGLEVFLCDRNNPNTIICQLGNSRGRSFQTELNSAGSGQLSISKYAVSPIALANIREQNFILCKLRGTPVFKWIIETIKPNYVDIQGQGILTIQGRGVLSMLEWAAIYPEDMINITTAREFTGYAGAILRTLLLEAQARGTLAGVNIDWTATEDSLGNPFTDATSISFHIGTPLSEVAYKFSTGLGMFDIEMTPDLQLRIYKSKGEDLHETVSYCPGQAMIEHSIETDATKVVNEVIVEGANGEVAISTAAEGVADWGRREGYLQARNISAGLSEYGQLYLNKYSTAVWGVSGTVLPYVDKQGRKLVPFDSYFLGDWINWSVPPDGADVFGFEASLRVKSITYTEDEETGAPYFALDLNNVMLENEIKTKQAVERLASYTSGESMSNPSVDSGVSQETFNDHTHTHSLLEDLDNDDHPQYLTEERHDGLEHSGIQRVSSLKASGEDALIGDVTLAAGSGISLSQTDETHVITITATGDSAYETAQLGGYSGTEVTFQIDLASIEGLADAIDAIVGV